MNVLPAGVQSHSVPKLLLSLTPNLPRLVLPLGHDSGHSVAGPQGPFSSPKAFRAMSKVCLHQGAFLDLLTLSSRPFPLPVLSICFALCIILQRAVQELTVSLSLLN